MLSTADKELIKEAEAPLKPRTGYQIFLRIACHKLKEIYGESSSSPNIRDMAIEAWRHLSEEDKLVINFWVSDIVLFLATTANSKSTVMFWLQNHALNIGEKLIFTKLKHFKLVNLGNAIHLFLTMLKLEDFFFAFSFAAIYWCT